MKRILKPAALALACALLAAGPALAAYPDHPITMIVPFAAGGSNDLPARVLARIRIGARIRPRVASSIVIDATPPRRFFAFWIFTADRQPYLVREQRRLFRER